ncbi:MAG: hypothetical protein KDA44_15390 [Planctomycetales bacterium]|nr:hypothetical protein [Planctomycetales bacterium]
MVWLATFLSSSMVLAQFAKLFDFDGYEQGAASHSIAVSVNTIFGTAQYGAPHTDGGLWSMT